MQTYWIPTRKDDEESFAQYKDRLSDYPEEFLCISR